MYSTCCYFTIVGLCSTFYSVPSHPAGKFLFYFFHIKSFQDTYITKPDGRSFILSNPHRDVDDTVFPSCSVLYIIFPLAVFQKRLINKPLFHFFFPLSQNDHKDAKVKLHLKKKKSRVYFLWQKLLLSSKIMLQANLPVQKCTPFEAWVAIVIDRSSDIHHLLSFFYLN